MKSARAGGVRYPAVTIPAKRVLAALTNKEANEMMGFLANELLLGALIVCVPTLVAIAVGIIVWRMARYGRD